ncbi:tachykinin-like peptides receptor 99D [Saccoglossus kowalevskii]
MISYEKLKEMFNLTDHDLFVLYDMYEDEGNSSYNYDDYEYEDLEMSKNWQTALTVAFSITIVLSVTGNAIVIAVLLCGKSCKNDLNAYLLNLAVADLTMTIFSMSFTFTTIMYGHWIFGQLMCPVTLFTLQVTVCVSIYTLTAIGIDRYYAIVYPLKIRASKYRNVIIIMVIWVVSIVSGIVQLVLGKTKKFYWDGQFLYSCSERWPTETSSAIYEVFVMCVTYFLPLLVLCYTYITVGFKLWGRKLPGNADEARDISNQRSKRKVIKMLVVLLLMFALCWMPLHVFNIIQRLHRDLKQQDTIRGVNAVLLWIAMSNTFVNPFIYCFMNEKFRYGVLLLGGGVIRRYLFHTTCCPEMAMIQLITSHSEGNVADKLWI